MTGRFLKISTPVQHSSDLISMLSSTCGIGKSIIGAKERCKGAGDCVAVGGDRGGGCHPVVQNSPLFLVTLISFQIFRNISL